MHTGQAVSRVLSRTVIPLGIPLPVCSSNLPERSAGSVIAFCLVLLRMGFGLPHIVTKCAVRPYRTFSPLPVLPQSSHRRFCFLFHFPSCCHARPLAGILPCAARTFLPAAETARRLSALPARGGLYRLRGSLKGGAVLLGSVRNIAKPCRPAYNADVFLVRQSCFQAAWIF